MIARSFCVETYFKEIEEHNRMEANQQTPLCMECRYFTADDRCSHARAIYVKPASLLRGPAIVIQYHAEDMRSGAGICGPLGKLFEAKREREAA